jgi:hypothetical protein
MDKMVARLNIQHFRELLEKESDEAKRKVLVRLLEEEEARLKALTGQPEKKHRRA